MQSFFPPEPTTSVPLQPMIGGGGGMGIGMGPQGLNPRPPVMAPGPGQTGMPQALPTGPQYNHVSSPNMPGGGNSEWTSMCIHLLCDCLSKLTVFFTPLISSPSFSPFPFFVCLHSFPSIHFSSPFSSPHPSTPITVYNTTSAVRPYFDQQSSAGEFLGCALIRIK